MTRARHADHDAPLVNPNPTSRRRTSLGWPVAGIVLAIALVAVVRPAGARPVPLYAVVAVGCAEMVLVAALCARPAGARVAVLLAGLLLPLPAFVAGISPLARFLLACFMALPFVAATAMLLAPPFDGIGARLAFIFALGERRARRRPRAFDAAALARLAIATAVLAAAIAAAKAAPRSGPGVAAGWLAAGVAMFALGEMLTGCLPLAAGALGVEASPLFRSPYRATSLTDFWARRWNVRTSGLFRRYCFALLARHGTTLALFATFAVSALGHAALADIALGRWAALSCALFFLVQPIAIGVERRMGVARWAPAAGWAWTMAFLTITSPLLLEPALRIVEQVWGPPGDVVRPTAAALGFVIAVSSVVALASLASASPEAPVESAEP